MKLAPYILRRLLLAIPVLFGVTLITFAISWAANEGDLSRAYVTEKMTPAQRERIVDTYGFDQPWYVQYFNYLGRLIKLDLGVSHSQNDRQITEVFAEFFPATIELTLVAMIVAIIGGIFLGTVTAIRKDSPIDHTTRFLALAGVSVPIFWLGLMLKFALATSFPENVIASAPPLVRGAFLALVALVPIMGGLFLADLLDSPRSTWLRLAVHAAIAALIATLLILIQWRTVALMLMVVAVIGYGVRAALKLFDRHRIPRIGYRLVAGGVLLVALVVSFTPLAPMLVRETFAFLPDFPLGGRFSNALVVVAGQHPSLTEGPTRLLLVDTALARDWAAFGDVLHHLALPGVTLGYASLAVIARMMRSSMLEVLSLDYLRTARAKGLSEHEIIRRHARRNALIPIATVIGLTFGSLVSGAVLTETIFQWPGLGRWSTNAIIAFDTNSIMSFTLLVVVIYLTANLIVDIAYSLLDPRVRLG